MPPLTHTRAHIAHTGEAQAAPTRWGHVDIFRRDHIHREAKQKGPHLLRLGRLPLSPELPVRKKRVFSESLEALSDTAGGLEGVEGVGRRRTAGNGQRNESSKHTHTQTS